MLIAAVQVLVMATWFSASAAVPALRAEWGISAAQATWLTASVQLGFVTGAVLSAVLNLADVVPAHRLVAACALFAAATTATIALLVDGMAAAVPLRFLTGMALAGVYPPGLKLMASWFSRGRGLALGVLVGALTLGSAVPQLVNGFSSLPWRAALLVASGLAVGGGLLTVLTINAVPLLVDLAGWRLAVVVLGIGPALGALAMRRLHAAMSDGGGQPEPGAGGRSSWRPGHLRASA